MTDAVVCHYLAMEYKQDNSRRKAELCSMREVNESNNANAERSDTLEEYLGAMAETALVEQLMPPWLKRV